MTTARPAEPRTAPHRHISPTDTGDGRGAPVDAARWPDVAVVPKASWPRTAVTRALVGHALRGLPLWTRFAGSEPVGRGGPLLEVRDPESFHARVGTHGLVGFGESYMAGEWDAPDLVAVLGESVRIGPADGRGRPDGTEQQNTGGGGTAKSQRCHSQSDGENGEHEKNTELKNEFVVGAEIPDRPVLHRGGRPVDRRAADHDDGAGLRPNRRRHQLCRGERGEACQRTAERGQRRPCPPAGVPEFLLVIGHVGNPVPIGRGIGRPSIG